MKILAIETSCDETAAAVLECKGGLKRPHFEIKSNIISSQVKIHRPYGGVVPNLAKREHQKNLIPVLKKALKEANILRKIPNPKSQIPNPKSQILNSILEREEILLKKTLNFLKKYEAPEIDLIAVTVGPGLAPALWPGVNLAKALAYFWQKPILGVDHIKAHISANWINPICAKSKIKYQKLAPYRNEVSGAGSKLQIKNQKEKKVDIKFPAICLVVSGGHTQLILMFAKGGKYRIIGETRDDAAGEAFDKVARLLGLGYPGGPQIARFAQFAQTSAEKTQKNAEFFPRMSALGQRKSARELKLPRPMINQNNFDLSFSGLKTAVLYLLQDLENNGDVSGAKNNNYSASEEIQGKIAKEFQQAVIDVLIAKTIGAAKKYKAKTIFLSGGVAANKELRQQMAEAVRKQIPNSKFQIPNSKLCTDNAAMIGAAAYFDYSMKPQKAMILKNKNDSEKISADPNLRV